MLVSLSSVLVAINMGIWPMNVLCLYEKAQRHKVVDNKVVSSGRDSNNCVRRRLISPWRMVMLVVVLQNSLQWWKRTRMSPLYEGLLLIVEISKVIKFMSHQCEFGSISSPFNGSQSFLSMKHCSGKHYPSLSLPSDQLWGIVEYGNGDSLLPVVCFGDIVSQSYDKSLKNLLIWSQKESWSSPRSLWSPSLFSLPHSMLGYKPFEMHSLTFE